MTKRRRSHSCNMVKVPTTNLRPQINNFFCRTDTKFNLPDHLCCGRLISLRTQGSYLDRVFFLGGANIAASSNVVYEWTESQGWAQFGALPALSSYTNLIAIVYNTD